MNEVQKKKRNIRKSKAWDAKRKSERERAGNKDEITLKPLRKGWALHHEDLDAENYGNLEGDDFYTKQESNFDYQQFDSFLFQYIYA